jgi:transcriptional regulator with XRE-family HTH domain
MAARTSIDPETRSRITGWIRVEMSDRGSPSVREFARVVGVSHAHLSRVLAGAQAPGLELVLRLVRRLEVSADRLLNEDPPGRVPGAREPGAGARRSAPAGPPAARRIDPDRWLARAREARALVKRPLTRAAARRLAGAGRP